MKAHAPDRQSVTLLLHDREGREWPLQLSRDCLQFIGRYPRIAEFGVDALILFHGIRRDA